MAWERKPVDDNIRCHTSSKTLRRFSALLLHDFSAFGRRIAESAPPVARVAA